MTEEEMTKYKDKWCQEAYERGKAEATKELEKQIEKMKCCYNCSKWNDGQCADVQNDNSYYSADFVCEDWEIKENDN